MRKSGKENEMTQISGKYSSDIKRLQQLNPFISNTQMVYTILLDRIVDHRLAPGKKLNQEQIAIDMNVSRTPVREAFFALEEEGFLEKGAQGYTVYEMNPGDYMQLLDVRMALEVLAARLACSRMVASERHGLEENLAKTDSILSEGVGSAWDIDFNIIDAERADKLFHKLGQIDHDFHFMIMEASHNKYLIEAYKKMDPKIHFFRYSAFSINACLNMAVRHRKIYDAVTARDEALAEDRMKTHLALTVPRAMGL